MRYLAVSPHFLWDMARLTSAETFAPARSLYETLPNFPGRWREINSRVLAGENWPNKKSMYGAKVASSGSDGRWGLGGPLTAGSRVY